MFNDWAVKHNKSYSSDVERDHRLKIFSDTLEYINEHNARTNTTFKLGLNQFSDLTNDEFSAMYTGVKQKSQPRARAVSNSSKVSISRSRLTSSSMDWRDMGAVTGVKNQKNCGGCWAFAAVGAIESANFLATNNLVTLSEQQLIDCTTADNGCDGGYITDAFDYVVSNGGIDSEDDYTYADQQNECDSDKANKVVVSMTGYQTLDSNDPDGLMDAVNQVPVGVLINGRATDFQNYASGIYDGDCSTKLTHAVLVVGYGGGDDSGDDAYWILKNSWGSSWGEDGYMRIVRADGDGKCGMNQECSYALTS